MFLSKGNKKNVPLWLSVREIGDRLNNITFQYEGHKTLYIYQTKGAKCQQQGLWLTGIKFVSHKKKTANEIFKFQYRLNLLYSL